MPQSPEAKMTARSDPTASNTTARSSMRDSIGGVSAGVNRSEHPKPRRSVMTSRPSRARSRRKRDSARFSQLRSTLEKNPADRQGRRVPRPTPDRRESDIAIPCIPRLGHLHQWAATRSKRYRILFPFVEVDLRSGQFKPRRSLLRIYRDVTPTSATCNGHDPLTIGLIQGQRNARMVISCPQCRHSGRTSRNDGTRSPLRPWRRS